MRDASSRKDYLTESGDGLWSRQSGRCNRAATFSGIAIRLPVVGQHRHLRGESQCMLGNPNVVHQVPLPCHIVSALLCISANSDREFPCFKMDNAEGAG